MMKKEKLLAITLAAVTVFGLTGCQETGNSGSANEALSAGGNSGEAPDGSRDKVVTIGMVSAWGSSCVYFDAGNYTDLVWEQVYDRLWVSNSDGTAEPRLAESYEFADDYSYFTVHLNEDAVFTDGIPVTSADVVYTAQLLSDPDFANVKGGTKLFAGTDDSGKELSENSIEVYAIDDHTVQFNLKTPVDEVKILNVFNRGFYVLPEHVFSRYSTAQLNENSVWKENAVGSGPWIYDSEIDGTQIEFTANKNYYLGAPDFDRLVIKVVAGSQLLSSLLAGEIDTVSGGGIGSIPLSDWPAAVAAGNLGTVSQTGYGYQAMIFNLQSDKIGNDLIRRGLTMAVNKQSIVDNLLNGEGVALYAPFSDEHPYVDYSRFAQYEYDPGAAKKLLIEGGFDFEQTLELIVPTGNEIRIQSTTLIQQDLAAIGVKADITQYDFPTLMQMMIDGEFDLGMCGAAGSIDPNSSAWLSNVSGINFTCVPDDRYVSLFTAADQVLDYEKKVSAYSEIWQKLQDEAPIAWLYAANDLIAYNKNKLSNLDPSKWTQIEWTTWEWDYIE